MSHRTTSTRKSTGISVGVSDRIKGLTVLGIIGIIVITIFLVAGWSRVWNKIADFAHVIGTVFDNAPAATK